MDRFSTQLPPPRGRQVSAIDAAHANEFFEPFLNAATLKNILGYYRSICDHLHLKPNVFPQFYPKLKTYLTTWRAKALWKKFDARASHKCYGKGKICANTRVLIIGAGPCGLRTAIEAQLLGAKVVVVEKRDRLSRNNVLHLWPFVIEDLRMLGAKKFFGKFCAGAIDHISIRQLQCILLKVALLLGVEVHTEVSFEKLIEPNAEEKIGWTAEFKPSNHPVSQYEFDVIIGADGKKNTLQGFKRKEFRGKLAIAITANFINKKTEAEARVEEISGVAFIFNQKFFKNLQEETRIDLENIVYYKDDTHYFVMTAKKASLLEKGVIKQDFADTEQLLSRDNVDRIALQNYAKEAANFSTNYQMPDLEFAVNHYGQPDVNMFDFTSMYQAENASKVMERRGYRLLMILVGDSLLEPFWPTGSGCARGFLSSLDAAWAIRSWGLGNATPLEVMAERESIYRLLPQTTPDNLNKDWKSYTLDPSTRYPNLNKNVISDIQTTSLFDTDNPQSIEEMRRTIREVQLEPQPKKRRRGNVDSEVLLNWINEQLCEHELQADDIGSIFKNGKILCAIVHHYRPDLLDINAINDDSPEVNNQMAFDVLEKELGVPPIITGEESTKTEDFLTLASYLTQVYDTFRGEIPHIKLPKLELPESNKRSSEASLKPLKGLQYHHGSGDKVAPITTSRPSSKHKRHAEAMTQSKLGSMERKTRKRRTLEKVGASVEERQKVLQDIVANRQERQNRRRQQRRLQTEQFLKSMQMLQANAKPDQSQPFEDYSIFLYRQTAPNFEDRVKDLEKKFTYVPDHDKTANRTGAVALCGDEEIAARIKSLEDKWRDPQPVEKKPKDLLRAIGKIDNSDWNIKEIEKKIRENKMGKSVNKDREKVPKWSKEQFLARQTKMEKKHLDRQDSIDAKYADIDKNIKHLELKLKEGTSRDLGQNKVASITEKLANKAPAPTQKIEKSASKPAINFAPPSSSDLCHFCGKRVYLMERLSAEGRFFHHGCFKCQYCHTQLRLGSYAFDRDGFYDNKFFCVHHYGMQGELKANKVIGKPSRPEKEITPESKGSGISNVDLLSKAQDFHAKDPVNLSAGHVSSDPEDSLSQMDEDEWTDKNFGASCAEEVDDSEDESSSLSDTDSDDEDAFDDALEVPATKEGTLKLAERLNKRYSRKHSDSQSDDYSSSDQSSYYENSSDDDESDTATEGEEEIRARELRKQEVRVEPPVVQTDTGTDTEVVTSDSSSESSSEIRNSATEISTDSEFALDDPTPTREIPSITFNDAYVTKTRGSSNLGMPRRIQVTSGYIQKQHNEHKAQKPQNIELKLQPLVPSGAPFQLKKPLPVTRTEGYALNRTQSTGGIATKVSLELKKKYLLGEPQPGNIQKSGSASTLDTKFKSFHTNISDCQKLLKPAAEISASMQTFCNKLDERTSPVSPQSSFLRQLDAIQKNKPATTNKENDKQGTDIKKEEKNDKNIVRKEDESVQNQKCIENNLPDVTNVTRIPEVPEEPHVFVNESEGRPRSPVHETSIIVPEIDWSKQKNSEPTDDSLSESEESSEELPKSPNFENIPRVEVHVANDDDKEDDFPLDSLIVASENQSSINSNVDPPKSISSERKMLNQPKPLPELKDILPQIHNEHITIKEKKDSPETENKSKKNSSGRSSPDSCAEQATCALTETELSDWARDGAVSDDLEDDLEFNQEKLKPKENVHYIEESPTVRIAKIVEFDELGHVCGKDKQAKEAKNKTIITEAMNNILSSNLDNIEFMDTGTETSSDDGVGDNQNNGYTGYVLFKNEDDIPEDSLNPNINVVEAKNEQLSEKIKNTGYCVLANCDNNFGGEVIDLKPSDLDELKQKQMQTDHEEDSLLILDPGTTTEENTCSDSTVKNITEITTDQNKLNEERKRLEDKLAKVKAEFEKQDSSQTETNEFKEHCQRLQSKVEFGNARDSIDIRKSRRKSKSEVPQKPDLIQEEKEKEPKDITLNLKPVVRTPDILYKKEVIQMERDENQKLIQEMVMNKMKAENKSLERKKRNRTISGISPGRPNELSKSATANIITKINLNNLDKPNRESAYSNRDSTYSTASSTYTTPDVLLPAKAAPLQTSKSLTAVPNINDLLNDVFTTPISSTKGSNSRPMSYHSFAERKLAEFKSKLPETPLTNPENFNLTDVKGSENFITPKPPPRSKHEEITRTTEKLKSEARVRARLLSNEDLGLSPEEKMAKLKEKYKRGKENEETDNIESLILSAERKNSFLYSNDTLSKKKNGSFKRSKSGESDGKMTTATTPNTPPRTKSTQEISKNLNLNDNNNKSDNRKICKSDPNLLETEVKPKKKSKDRERRRSITKMITGIFNKISPKAKENHLSKETVLEEPIRQKSNSEVALSNKLKDEPPPVPPLPLNYTRDESSDGDPDWKRDRSSCDTLDQSGLVENSVSSATGKKAQKARKHVRQTQLKRHRMAQEIQRKLEETEVKTRELEERGVLVEKALRGEALPPNNGSKDETDLMQEWFDLMRDRTELRRYEKELMVRAQELELEDRHARLQQELRERLEIEGDKTEEDLRIEQNIVTEMMDIVTKRDRLIAVLEEERLRYSNEDRDLEEQMLAKGLHLTPIRKSTDN